MKYLGKAPSIVDQLKDQQELLQELNREVRLISTQASYSEISRLLSRVSSCKAEISRLNRQLL